MNKIDIDWLEEFDQAMLGLYAINHSDAGMDEQLLVSYYDLDRMNPLWPPMGLALNS